MPKPRPRLLPVIKIEFMMSVDAKKPFIAYGSRFLRLNWHRMYSFFFINPKIVGQNTQTYFFLVLSTFHTTSSTYKLFADLQCTV